MNRPMLVDTSVWIDFFKGVENEAVQTLTSYLTNDDPIFLCPVVIQEILQGVTDDQHFEELKEYLLAFNILLDDALEMAISAANLYRSMRKKGITIRKSNDCLIAQYAIKHALALLHNDRDFDLILKHKPS